jgi:class 3 adenylate cyclase
VRVVPRPRLLFFSSQGVQIQGRNFLVPVRARIDSERMIETEAIAMGGVISAHHGMVNDSIGDGILAVLGPPLDDPDHARHAKRYP